MVDMLVPPECVLCLGLMLIPCCLGDEALSCATGTFVTEKFRSNYNVTKDRIIDTMCATEFNIVPSSVWPGAVTNLTVSQQTTKERFHITWSPAADENYLFDTISGDYICLVNGSAELLHGFLLTLFISSYDNIVSFEPSACYLVTITLEEWMQQSVSQRFSPGPVLQDAVFRLQCDVQTDDQVDVDIVVTPLPIPLFTSQIADTKVETIHFSARGKRPNIPKYFDFLEAFDSIQDGDDNKAPPDEVKVREEQSHEYKLYIPIVLGVVVTTVIVTSTVILYIKIRQRSNMPSQPNLSQESAMNNYVASRRDSNERSAPVTRSLGTLYERVETDIEPPLDDLNTLHERSKENNESTKVMLESEKDVTVAKSHDSCVLDNHLTDKQLCDCRSRCVCPTDRLTSCSQFAHSSLTEPLGRHKSVDTGTDMFHSLPVDQQNRGRSSKQLCVCSKLRLPEEFRQKIMDINSKSANS